MILPWLIALIVTVVLNVVAYVITPKPKGPKPDAVTEGENPTASAGKPIPVVFGTVMIKEVNVLGYWDKATRTQEISS
jgi:hypothetical protein